MEDEVKRQSNLRREVCEFVRERTQKTRSWRQEGGLNYLENNHNTSVQLQYYTFQASLDAHFDVLQPHCALLVEQWHLAQVSGDLLESWTLASTRLTVECPTCKCLPSLLALALIPWKRKKKLKVNQKKQVLLQYSTHFHCLRWLLFNYWLLSSGFCFP